jgi:ribosomal protein S18 acetylase RimI-like enzyme
MDEEADLFEHHLLLSQSDAGAISSDIEEYPPLIGKLFVLNRLYVEGEYRGRGFAAMMINDAINRFVGEQDVMSLFAIPQDSGMDQKRLVKLYQEHGFSRTPLADNHLVYLGWSR